ncbi:hypothetical protein N1851_030866 [Merluccius polli]|uniref:Uncharacterized protein n=1 Tax=Merluccius polli TaxID=89951 RepID=A0AA47M4R9_MERPO|nr:hypothetical protein N1851_030866 [Merluccius polli]
MKELDGTRREPRPPAPSSTPSPYGQTLGAFVRLVLIGDLVLALGPHLSAKGERATREGRGATDVQRIIGVLKRGTKQEEITERDCFQRRAGYQEEAIKGKEWAFKPGPFDCINDWFQVLDKGKDLSPSDLEPTSSKHKALKLVPQNKEQERLILNLVADLRSSAEYLPRQPLVTNTALGYQHSPWFPPRTPHPDMAEAAWARIGQNSPLAALREEKDYIQEVVLEALRTMYLPRCCALWQPSPEASPEGPPYGPVGRLCEACSCFRLSDKISLRAASYHRTAQVSRDPEEQPRYDDVLTKFGEIANNLEFARELQKSFLTLGQEVHVQLHIITVYWN